ncbi:MAG: hypothetical protein R6V04_07250, partial [bacterium]
MKFITNGEKPDSLVKVVVHVVLNEDASVKGDGEVMVKGEKVKIEFLDTNNEVCNHIQIALWDNAYESTGIV